MNAKAIPVFNDKFHVADSEEADVSGFCTRPLKLCTEFVIENIPVV